MIPHFRGATAIIIDPGDLAVRIRPFIRCNIYVVKIVSVVILLPLLCPLFVCAQRTSGTDSPLSGKTRAELIQCFADRNLCGAESKWDVADLLGKTGYKEFLLSEFELTRNAEEKSGIIYALYKIDDPAVAAFFKRLVKESFDDGESLYYPLNYLAKRCDNGALRILSGNGRGHYPGYPGCLQWSTTVELFGKCRYRPAAPYLIDSLDAACLNIGVAADDSLRAIFPSSPTFDSAPKEQAYFRRRAREGARMAH